MQYYQQHKKGIIGTVTFHVIVLIMLILFGFFTPLPLPGEEGILVSFGNSNNGLGTITSPVQNNRELTQQVQREERVVTPPPQTVTPPPATQRQEPVVTQNQEQTAAIDAAERARREEADRQQQAERERQRQAELERQRIAEAERLEQQKINEINSIAQNAFNNSGAGGTGTSQGVTFPGGNQGSTTGDPNAGNLGQGGSGSGNQGTGVSFSLAGRSALSLPKPDYPGNVDGVVVVRITVDKNGNVTAAESGVTGTTIMNSQLLTTARQAALKAKFNADENATVQSGTITYRFVLN